MLSTVSSELDGTPARSTVMETHSYALPWLKLCCKRVEVEEQLMEKQWAWGIEEWRGGEGALARQSLVTVAMAVSPLHIYMRGKESEAERVGEWGRTSVMRCLFLLTPARHTGPSPAYGQHVVAGCCARSATWPIWNGHQTLIRPTDSAFSTTSIC
jgi:hypothetical protein